MLILFGDNEDQICLMLLNLGHMAVRRYPLIEIDLFHPTLSSGQPEDVVW